MLRVGRTLAVEQLLPVFARCLGDAGQFLGALLQVQVDLALRKGPVDPLQVALERVLFIFTEKLWTAGIAYLVEAVD